MLIFKERKKEVCGKVWKEAIWVVEGEIGKRKGEKNLRRMWFVNSVKCYREVNEEKDRNFFI